MKKDARQEQIIHEAIEILAAQGIQSLTTKNLAQAVGISEPALYRHFENKHAILMGVLDSFEEIACAVLERLEENAPALSNLRTFVFDRYQRFSLYPALAKVMFTETAFDFDPVLSGRMLDIMHRHRDVLMDIIKQGQVKKELREDIKPKELFRLIIGSMRLIIQQWTFSGFKFDLKTEGAALWNALEKLLQP